MKKNFLLSLMAFLSLGSYAQLTIQSGATFFIQSGATVTVQGDVTANADIQGPGLLLLKGTALQTVNMNGFSIPNVQIDNGNNITLGGAANVTGSLTFTTGKVQLNNFDLTLASAATLAGFDNSKYFITNSTGRLVKNALSGAAYTFPVGFDASTYNPLTVTQGGTVDNIGVRCLPTVLQNGTSGSAFVKEVVNASWAVSEAVAGGSSLTLMGQWTGTDELPGFNRTKTGLSYYDGVGWDMLNSQTAAASGAGPYTITRSAVTNLANGGVFAVGTRPVLAQLRVAPKVYLQGAYTGAAIPMNDGLRSAGVIPTSEPYSAIPNYTHSGSGGAETVPSSILAGTGTGNDIVDWAFAQLHRSSDGVVIATRAVLLQRDGFVVDLDGTNTKVNYVNFAGEAPGSYYVSLRHRNHLGIRTAGLLALTRTTNTTYDFTTAQTQAYRNLAITSNLPMAQNGTAFLMWAGNINSDDYVRVTSQALPPIPSDAAFLLANILGGNSNATFTGYSLGDVNMDGRARATSQALPPIPSDVAFILATVLGGNSNATVREHK